MMCNHMGGWGGVDEWPHGRVEECVCDIGGWRGVDEWLHGRIEGCVTTWEGVYVWMCDHMGGWRGVCGCVTHGRVGCRHV